MFAEYELHVVSDAWAQLEAGPHLSNARVELLVLYSALHSVILGTWSDRSFLILHLGI